MNKGKKKIKIKFDNINYKKITYFKMIFIVKFNLLI